MSVQGPSSHVAARALPLLAAPPGALPGSDQDALLPPSAHSASGSRDLQCDWLQRLTKTLMASKSHTLSLLLGRSVMERVHETKLTPMLTFFQFLDTEQCKPANYGLDGTTNGAIVNTKKIFYCVHGNTKDCCGIEGYVNGSGSHRNSVTLSSLENEHCHDAEAPLTDQRARRKLILASILCVLFMVAEGVGGYLSNSLAIATDAAHLLTDFASFMISLFSLWVSRRPATRKMSFGWYRAEVIGALTSVMMIWVVTGILVYLAVERIMNKTFEIDAQLMLITSAIGVGVNLIMGLTLHQHGHSHADATSSHSHEENINVRAALIHVIGDFIQSFGVLVAALIIYFKPTWLIVDPICTFLFSVLVVVTTFAIIRDTVTVLMEGIPRGVDFVQVTETFLAIEGVLKVHNLRIWALSLDKVALSAHLAISPGVNPLKVLTTASKSIKSKYNFFEITLQIEEFLEKMDDCFQCKMPEK